MVELRANRRIPLAVCFITGEKLHLRAQLALVERVLSILDFDVVLALFDHAAVGVRPGEALDQIGVRRLHLQFPGNLKRRFLRGRLERNPAQFAEPQI